MSAWTDAMFAELDGKAGKVDHSEPSWWLNLTIAVGRAKKKAEERGYPIAVVQNIRDKAFYAIVPRVKYLHRHEVETYRMIAIFHPDGSWTKASD
jgi:hypothetical protein